MGADRRPRLYAGADGASGWVPRAPVANIRLRGGKLRVTTFEAPMAAGFSALGV